MNLGIKCERLTNTDRKLICLALRIYSNTNKHRIIGKNKEYNKLIFLDIEQICIYLNALYNLVVDNKWFNKDSTLTISYTNIDLKSITLHKEWSWLIKHKEDIWNLVTKLVKP